MEEDSEGAANYMTFCAPFCPAREGLGPPVRHRSRAQPNGEPGYLNGHGTVPGFTHEEHPWTSSTERARRVGMQQETGIVSRAKEKALQLWKSIHHLRRRTLEEAWEFGGALTVIKKELGYGDWMRWLDEVGISHDVANRCIRVNKGYDFPQIAEFDSVHEALKALPPARLKQKKGTDGPESLKPVEKRAENGQLVDGPEDTPPGTAEGSEEPEDNASLKQDGAANNGDDDDLEEAVLLGKDPGDEDSTTQGPADPVPQVQGVGNGLSAALEEAAETADTLPLPVHLEDAHEEIRHLRQKLRESEERQQKTEDLNAELLQEVNRLRQQLADAGPRARAGLSFN